MPNSLFYKASIPAELVPDCFPALQLVRAIKTVRVPRCKG
jgi:hypothetical protein